MANTGRTHFKVGNPPPPHRSGCKCFRCTKIIWNKGLKGKQPYMNLSGLTGVKKHTEETKAKMRIKALSRYGNEHRTSTNEIERSRFRKYMNKQIFERDDYTCQLCGATNDLQVDHIQKWSEYVELRFSIYNCRTVCRPCHYFITNHKPMPKNSGWALIKRGDQ